MQKLCKKARFACSLSPRASSFFLKIIFPEEEFFKKEFLFLARPMQVHRKRKSYENPIGTDE